MQSYKSKDVIPGSHADTVGCHYCLQGIAMHCNGLKTCDETWEKWESKAVSDVNATKKWRRCC